MVTHEQTSRCCHCLAKPNIVSQSNVCEHVHAQFFPIIHVRFAPALPPQLHLASYAFILGIFCNLQEYNYKSPTKFMVSV